MVIDPRNAHNQVLDVYRKSSYENNLEVNALSRISYYRLLDISKNIFFQNNLPFIQTNHISVEINCLILWV